MSTLALAAAAIGALATDAAAWARRCYTIRDKHGVLRPFELNGVQVAIGADEARQLRETGQCRQLTLKARQGGVSTYEQMRALHQVWGTPNFDALTLAHTREDTDTLFEITQRAIEHFPPALLPRLGGKETREISFPGLDTHFFTRTAGAKRTGRGMTLRRLHGSEFAFWDDPEGTLATVTPALVPRWSVVALETTGSGYDSDAHNFWREAKAKGYEPLFFPWWECDPANYRLPLLADDELGALEPDEQYLVERRGLDREQIKWRRAKMAEIRKARFFNEFAEDPESCWLATGGMFYDAELLKALMLRAPEPLRTDLNGALEVYGELAEGDRAIIGADTAEGGGGDRSAYKARAFRGWRRLETYQSRDVPPREFARLLNAAGRRLNLAFLVVEKNAHGITVLRHLRDDHNYPASRIYHRVPLDAERAPHNADVARIGWATTGESKPILLDAGSELLAAARDGYAEVPCKAALRDAFGVRRDKTGTVQLTGRDVWVAECLAWIGRGARVSDVRARALD